MFAELPSSLRTKFENKIGNFLNFVQDENNLEEMQELGLANKNQIKTESKPAKPSLDAVRENSLFDFLLEIFRRYAIGLSPFLVYVSIISHVVHMCQVDTCTLVPQIPAGLRLIFLRPV